MQSDPASAHDEMVDAIAKIISGAPFPSERSRNKARAALAVARPVIREECARVAIKEARELEIANATDGDIHSVKIRAGGIMAAKDIAAAIRAME
jgi:hypothetical protein